MTDQQCVAFLQWALPQLRLRWPGFRKVRRQVHKRIDRRIGTLGLVDLADYRTYLESNPGEWPVLDGLCRISISRFYRDRAVWDRLRDAILPELARRATATRDRELRTWCAGCASGEEPYTLAALWNREVRPRFPKVRLRQLATDADGHLLERARQARYRPSSLKDVPPDWPDTVFVPSGEEYVLRPEFAVGIEFRRQDIRTELPDGPFQLVLCRYLVFTYFDEELQRAMLSQLVGRLVPEGVLVIGKQESVPEGVEGVRPLERNLGIYQR